VSPAQFFGFETADDVHRTRMCIKWCYSSLVANAGYDWIFHISVKLSQTCVW